MRDDDGIPGTARQCGLPDGNWVAAAPSVNEVTLFRAVENDPPTLGDFKPHDPETAEEAKIPQSLGGDPVVAQVPCPGRGSRTMRGVLVLRVA